MNQKQALISGVLAGIGASLCCVGPLVLLGLGVGGAWVANLTLFEPIRPVFLLLTFFFLGLAFHKLYLTPLACDLGKPCIENATLKRHRIIFWLVTVPLLGLVALPWYVQLFY